VDLAVIIPAHNEAERIGAQLDALEAQYWDGDWEVVVVDNRSTDGTAAVVTERARSWPRLRLVTADDRGDKAYAVNTAVGATDADALAFTDADDVVGPGWIAAMGDALRRAEFVTGPLELDLLNPEWLVHSRGRRGEEAPVAVFEGLFPFARGNNYGLTRATWERVGPLPEAAFPTEDMQLSLDAHRAGIELVGVPEALVHYRYRTDPRSLWRQGYSYGAGRCRIVRDLIDHGDDRPGRFAGWRSWLWLLACLPRTLTATGRVTWTWVAANRIGQLVGSAHHRVIYL